MIETKSSKIVFGGDYCPEQWDDETIKRDIKLMKNAHVNSVVLSVFTWEILEPKENEYHFEWLDKVMKELHENDIYICLATPTSAQPAWMSTKYPEVLPVDIKGRKRNHGMRVFFCINSKKYRERAAKLARKLAERYKDFPGLIAWHVANEYGTYCYCENCQQQFREWLKNKYQTIENFNNKMNSVFWGRQISSFKEVMVPSELNDDYRFYPALQLDYLRFISDSTVSCFLNEADVIRKITPKIPVYTNISGHIKNIDQFKMAKTMDFVGWDNYPVPREKLSTVALKHDLMRALKSGESFLIAEQSPNQQNWQPYNKIKKPGEVKTIAYQGLAHGGDGCFFFQMKQSIGGQEKFHGALIGHSGRGDTRVFREMTELGEELEKIGNQFVGAKNNNKVAIYFDWESWWDLDNASGPSQDLEYFEEVNKYYQPFYDNNIGVDIISKDADISKYKLIVAPSLYIISKKTAANINKFVENGGVFVGSIRSGVVDEFDRCSNGLAPGILKDVLGIEIEEMDALFPGESNELEIVSNWNDDENIYKVNLLCEIITLKGAETVAKYRKEFYSGTPCVTKNRWGKGEAYYIGTSSENKFLTKLFSEICLQNDIPSYIQSDKNIEITCRSTSKGDKYYFVINHNDVVTKVNLPGIIGINLFNNKKIQDCYQMKAREILIIKAKK